MKNSLDQIKKLRLKTKAGVMDCRQALEEAGGDLAKAEACLKKKFLKKAEKRTERETACGLVEAYTHGEGKIVAIVELCCETDFVARTKEFKDLAHELSMQVAAMKPQNPAALLKQPWIRDEKKTIGDLVKEVMGKTGENIKVNRLARFQLGE
ncbi:elongation factor Ts [Candidatus Shapirobacteria bacterium]|nr:elongation factor Ts [Candidatus Shapirobacteria bacterium]